MSLIVGVGDEVIHFFTGLFLIVTVLVAWRTTSISEQSHIRTVLLVDRRQRTHQRLSNYTQSVTITEGTSVASSSLDETVTHISSSPMEEVTSSSTLESTAKSESSSENGHVDDEQTVIDTMDTERNVLSRRRPFFSWNNSTGVDQEIISTNLEHETEFTDDNNKNTFNSVLGSNTKDSITSIHEECKKVTEDKTTCVSGGTKIRIKLKYINDDFKIVDGDLHEVLGNFKRRHFQMELDSNKLVKLIFNGQMLQRDSATLSSLGLFHNCVVHCLIHQKRTQPGEGDENQNNSQRRNGIVQFNNNNQGRDWDLGSFLLALVSFALLTAWYFRYLYSHLYTLPATMGLIIITGIFTVIFLGTYFPGNDQASNSRVLRTEDEQE